MHCSIQQLHEKSKTVAKSAEMKVLREKMQDDINSVSKQVQAIKAKLEALDRDNQQAKLKKVRTVDTSHHLCRSRAVNRDQAKSECEQASRIHSRLISSNP